MARSNEIQYVRYYSAGSAAQKVELPQKEKKQPKPKAKPAAKPMVHQDGLAVVSLVVTAVMLVLILVGAMQNNAINRQIQDLEVYVSQLELKQDQLEADYAHGYSLNQVRMAAQSMGLVPVEQVVHITVSVPETEQPSEPAWWQTALEQIRDFFA